MGFLINPFLLSAPVSGFDADAQAYFDKLDNAGYPLDSAQQDWVNNRVLNLKGTAAGDITTEAVDVWNDIELLVFYLYNAGAGTTAYAVVGGDSTGTITWETEGVQPGSGANHTFASSQEIAAGRHNGLSVNLKASQTSGQSFSTFLEMNGGNYRVETTNSSNLKFSAGNSFDIVIPSVGHYDIQHILINLTGESSGVSQKGRLRVGGNDSGWVESGVTFTLPDPSDIATQLDIGEKNRTRIESVVFTSAELTEAQSDNVQAILDAVN